MGLNNTQALTLLLMSLAICLNNAHDSTTLVLAIIIFGDSAADVRNNDYILTLFKANYPPYGRDFVTYQPTGRFCNGKLVIDMTADALGFTTYPSADLSPQASGKNLLIGANFASASAGYDDKTSILNVSFSNNCFLSNCRK
ncbi:GDSL esterase/lipase [Capsicum annuum]|uniref:GDSL esterase/lipase n=1 Tax=Capsicum annuum TaxID=4072 RepID=A0A2G2YFE1_CAPAN|nr:GDSL esterase/lipase [Capsicum annuum]